MALNPFFLQGSQSEQRLIQELINEQLTIYGVEVAYLPRRIVKKDNILNELESSKFVDNFMLEAYVNNYEGYTGAGDILSKFGVNLKDELTLTISKERYEDFISPFLSSISSEVEITTRPMEGDLIYFPLGKRLFEIKFVEHEKPFYQLGKNYVYELKCELFELSDEVGGWDQIDSVTEEIDEVLETQGYLTTLKLISIGSTATVGLSTTSGYIRKITLTNDGYGYTKKPTVSITPVPTDYGVSATAVAITTSVNNVYSVKEILITNPGYGYVTKPTVSIISAGETVLGEGYKTYGTGATAEATLVTDGVGIGTITITDHGSGYTSIPTIQFDTPSSGIGTASGRVVINESTNRISGIELYDAGIGYTSGTATANISNPSILIGTGIFQYNELVTGSISGATARVKTWNASTNTLTVGTTNGTFVSSDVITGSSSNASYSIDYIEDQEFSDKYDKSDEIETEADLILDFTESNPFGNY